MKQALNNQVQRLFHYTLNTDEWTCVRFFHHVSSDSAGAGVKQDDCFP